MHYNVAPSGYKLAIEWHGHFSVVQQIYHSFQNPEVSKIKFKIIKNPHHPINVVHPNRRFSQPLVL